MKVDSLSELQLYINLLQQTNKKIYSDYNELIKELKKEFNINVTIDDLNKLNEPTIEEELIDKELLLKNIFSW